MKHLRWLPFAFLAGTHGFAFFAPYATFMLALTHLIGRRRRRLQARSAINELAPVPRHFAPP